jgi:nitrate reductase NapE component
VKNTYLQAVFSALKNPRITDISPIRAQSRERVTFLFLSLWIIPSRRDIVLGKFADGGMAWIRR